MRYQRNPFRFRASEHISSDQNFLKLFGPEILEIIPKENIFYGLSLFRSAAGGGKTSLMRLFTPTCLNTLYENRNNDDYKRLYEGLKKTGAFSELGPNVLGIMISIKSGYAPLEELIEVNVVQKNRMLLCLLNCRIILASLRGILLLKRGFIYPDDLDKISFELDSSVSKELNLPPLINGKLMYDWARSIENNICDALDSLEPSINLSGQVFDSPFAFSLLKSDKIKLDGTKLVDNIVVIIDDFERITARQRKYLLNEFTNLRNSACIWVAERLEALDPDELLSNGIIGNRDYSHIINLEEIWRNRRKRFENSVNDIADRRAHSTYEVEIGSFAACLQNSHYSSNLEKEYKDALEKVISRVKQISNKGEKFKEWIQLKEALDGTVQENLLSWRTTEILIERELDNRQLTLDLIPLDAKVLIKNDVSLVRAAAEAFLSKEFNLPYYFGFDKLASISSSNVEQFLELSAELFEEIVSAALIRKTDLNLSIERQDKIIQKYANYWWQEELSRRISHAREVRLFTESIGKFSYDQTYRPTAPYPPGVTGIAISMEDRDLLRNVSFLRTNKEAELLSTVLSECIANNIFEVDSDHSQNYEKWMVLYLNRLICVKFHLPLGYGGWRHIKLEELYRWLKGNYKPTGKGERLV